MNEYKKMMKKRRQSKIVFDKSKKEKCTYSLKLVSRLLITVIITLITLIILKQNPKLKSKFKEKILENSFSFSSVNKFYEENFGSQIPFKKLFKEETKTVFNEKLVYKEVNKHLDGVKLTVDRNYLVPVRETGIVIFIGEKKGYGNVVIIEDTSGIETWYGNINKANIKVYDYVDKGTYLGETKDNILYLTFKKEGKFLEYTKYIN